MQDINSGSTSLVSLRRDAQRELRSSMNDFAALMAEEARSRARSPSNTFTVFTAKEEVLGGSKQIFFSGKSR